MSTQNQIVNNAVNQAMNSIDPNAQANIPGVANSTNANPNTNAITPAPNQGGMSSTPIKDAGASVQERQATAPGPYDWIGSPNVTNRKKKSKTPSVPPLSPQGTQNNTVSPVAQPQNNQDMNFAPQVSENPPMYQRNEQDMNYAPQVSENPPMYQRDEQPQQPKQSDPNDRIGNPNVTPHAPYKYVPGSSDRYLKGIASGQQYDSEQMQTPAYKNAQKRNADIQGLMSKTPQEIAKQISTNPLMRGGRAMRDLLSFDPQRHAQILQEYTKYKDLNDINTSMKRQFDGKTVGAKVEEPNPLQALNNETDAMIEESYGKDIAKKMQLREELRNSTYITTKAQAINELNNKKMKLQEQMSMAEKEARAQLGAEAPESLVSAYVNRLSRGLSEQMRTLDMDIMTEQNALQIERDNVKERMDDLNYLEEQKMKQDQINRNIFESDRAFGMQEKQFNYGMQKDQRDYNYSVQKDERAYNMAMDEIQNDPKNNMEVSPGVYYNTRTGKTTDLNSIKEQYFQSKEGEIRQQADQMFGGGTVTSLEDYATISTPKMKQAISFVEETVKKGNNGSRGQCGAYCNDYLIKMGDKDYKFFQNSLKDKKSKVNSKTPVVGSIMVMDSPVKASKGYGHVAIVKSMNPDGTMNMVDANGFGAGKEKVGEFKATVKNGQYFVNGKSQGNMYGYYVPNSVKSEKTVGITNQITGLRKQGSDNNKKQQWIDEQVGKVRGEEKTSQGGDNSVLYGITKKLMEAGSFEPKDIVALGYDPIQFKSIAPKLYVEGKQSELAPLGATIKDQKAFLSKPAKTREDITNGLVNTNSIINSLTEYKSLFKDSGGELTSRSDSGARLDQIKNNLALQLKEVANLGVLNGKDYEILLSQIPDGTSFKNWASGGRFDKLVDSFEKDLKNKIKGTLSSMGVEYGGIPIDSGEGGAIDDLWGG